MPITVHFDKNYHSVQGSINSTFLVMCSISSDDLIAGHRYLVLGTCLPIGGSVSPYVRMYYGGSADNNLRADWQLPSGGSNTYTSNYMKVWTAVEGEDIEWTIQRSSSNNGVVRNASLMAIDLDSGGLTEDEDWFYAIDTQRMVHVHHSFSQPAAVIETYGGGNITEGDTFEIDDNEGNVVTFEFDSDASVSGGNVAISYTGGDSTSTVRTSIINAINGASINVFASAQGSTQHTLVRPNSGASQKIDMTGNMTDSLWRFSDWHPAVLTFTPDGTSDYLVFGCVGFDNGGSRQLLRVRDVTNGNTITQYGGGGGTECVYASMGIMQAPTAQETKLVTEFRSFGHTEKDEAIIFVLRLDAFSNFTYFDSDLNTSPSTSRTQRGSTLNFTPDDTEEILVLAMSCSQGDGSSSTTSSGVRADVEQDGGIIWDTGSVSNMYHGDGSSYTGNDGSRPGAFVFEYLEGETSGVEQDWKLFTTSPTTASSSQIRQQMLLVMSTQEYLEPPAQVTNPSPSNGATLVARNVDLSWTAAVGDGEITYDVYFGDGYVDVDQELASAFQGNQTDITFDIPILEANTTYYWKINPINAGGTTTGETYSFTTGNADAPGKVIIPTPLNGATLVDVTDAQSLTLMWNTGINTDTFDVYFGTDPSLDAYTFRANTALTTHQEFDINFRQTYYWRIDSIGAGGLTTGDTFSFSTVPLKFTAPSDGDKVYGVVVASGLTGPGHGVHAELHSGGLLGDGYVVADATTGQFDVVIPFSNLEFGKEIKLVAVSQASPDSEEIDVTLTQARKFPELPRGHTGRRMIVDDNTIALYELGEPVVGPDDNTSTWQYSSAFNGTSAPSQFSFAGTTGFEPTISDGIMTIYQFNDSSRYSRIQNFNTGPMPDFTTGFTYKTRVRYAPNPLGTVGARTNYHQAGNTSNNWGVTCNEGTAGGFYFSNTNDNVSYSIPFDSLFDWNEIVVRGKQLTSGDNTTCYLELYVNGHKRYQGYASTGGGYVNYLGNPFTDGIIWTADYHYYDVDITDPFTSTHCTNAEGTASLDLTPVNNPSARPVDDPTVPFSHAVRFNGSDQYLISADAALDLSAPFTIEFWFRTNTSGVTQVLVGKESTPTNGFNIYLDTNNTLTMFTADGSNNVLSNLPTAERNKWHYAAMSYDGTNLAGYFDGILFDRQARGFTANTAQNFSIGADSTSPTSYFSGDMAQLKVSNRVVPDWEIYNNYFAVDDPVAELPADDSTVALFDLRNQDYIGTRYTYSTHPNGTVNAPKYFDFTEDAEYYSQFFSFLPDNLGNTSGDGYAGVRNNVIELSTVAETGFQHYSYAETWGKCRFKGNFDVTVTIDYTEQHPVPNGATNYPVYMLFYTMSNVYRLYYYYESNSTIQIGQSKASNASGPDDRETTTISQPSSWKLRVRREDSKWKFTYGLNGADPTTEMPSDVEMVGPTEDVWWRLLNYTAVDIPDIGDGAYTVSVQSIDVQGVNGAAGDGYLLHDTKGGIQVTAVGESPFGPVYAFDGINDYILLHYHPDYSHADMTWEIWAKPNSLHDGRLIGREGAPTPAKWSMDLGADGYFSAEVRDSGNISVSVQGYGYVPDKWQHFAMTYSATEKTLKIFLNGIQIGSSNNPSMGEEFGTSLGVYVGSNFANGFQSTPYDGDIATMRMSNRVRTPLEIFNIVHGAKVKED